VFKQVVHKVTILLEELKLQETKTILILQENSEMALLGN
jgi:hypothetical protein